MQANGQFVPRARELVPNGSRQGPRRSPVVVPPPQVEPGGVLLVETTQAARPFWRDPNRRRWGDGSRPDLSCSWGIVTAPSSDGSDYRDVLLKIQLRSLQQRAKLPGLSKKDREVIRELTEDYVNAAILLPPGDDGLYLLVDASHYFYGDLFGMWFMSERVSEELAKHGTQRETVEVLKDAVFIMKTISPKAPKDKYEFYTFSFRYEHAFKSQKEEELTDADVVSRVIDELKKDGRLTR